MSLSTWLQQGTLRPRVRAALAGAAAVLLAAVWFPLWTITMFAGQFPEGIRMSVFAHKLVGGNNGADIQSINILNHYIGMQEIHAASFPEMKWIPFALGLFLLLSLRTAVFGKVSQLVDLLVLFTYFGLFSLGTFWYRLYTFGHRLSPDAPVTVEPFTPPVFGHQRIANFDVYSYPGPTTCALGVFALVLGSLLFLEWRRARREA